MKYIKYMHMYVSCQYSLFLELQYTTVCYVYTIEVTDASTVDAILYKIQPSPLASSYRNRQLCAYGLLPTNIFSTARRKK